MSRGKANPFPPAKIVLLCLVRISLATLPEYLEGRTPKEKHPFFFQKEFTLHQTKNARSVFLSGLPSEARRWRDGSPSVRSRSKPSRAPRVRHWTQSRIFDKVGSSEVVNILQKSRKKWQTCH